MSSLAPVPVARLTLTRPDDWHLHLRDGDVLASVLPDSARRFARAIVMPNLAPPVTTTAQAEAYRERILAALPPGHAFEPLMTLFLTENMAPDEIARARESGIVHAVKYYPAHGTSNAAAGVTDLRLCYPVPAALERQGMPLLLHGEVTDPAIDIFDREAVFIERHLEPLVRDFPGLRMVLEHITTRTAAEFIRAATASVAATITAHHLLLNRNAMFAGGMRPHHLLPAGPQARDAPSGAPGGGNQRPPAVLPGHGQCAAPTAGERSPPAVAPGSIRPTRRSSSMPRRSSRLAPWIVWKPSPVSTGRTSMGCHGTGS